MMRGCVRLRDWVSPDVCLPIMFFSVIISTPEPPGVSAAAPPPDRPSHAAAHLEMGGGHSRLYICFPILSSVSPCHGLSVEMAGDGVLRVGSTHLLVSLIAF